jgi:hypothetical protein
MHHNHYKHRSKKLLMVKMVINEKKKQQWQNMDNGSINPINGFYNIDSGLFVMENMSATIFSPQMFEHH